MKKYIITGMAATLAIGAGCATNTGTYGLGGAAAGAATGAALNHKDRGKGAVVGGLVGGLLGGALGNAKDKKSGNK